MLSILVVSLKDQQSTLFKIVIYIHPSFLYMMGEGGGRKEDRRKRCEERRREEGEEERGGEERGREVGVGGKGEGREILIDMVDCAKDQTVALRTEFETETGALKKDVSFLKFG